MDKTNKKTFDEAIAGIRKAERGVEVREDIAQGMEYVKQYAEEVTGQQQAALQAAQTATSAARTATEKAAAAAESETAANTAAASAGQSAQAASEDAGKAASSAAAAKASADKAAAAANTDKTLTIEDAPADAKATGNALNARYTKEEADKKFVTPDTLPIATADTLGGIKVGNGIIVDKDGNASIDAYDKTETDALLDALQEQVDDKISSATSISASGSNYVRFTDGTQICWKTIGSWASDGGYVFRFPVPFSNANYGIGYAFGGSVSSGSDVSCVVNKRYTTSLGINNSYDGSVIVIGRWK